MKWLRILALVVVILPLSIPSAAFAGTSEGVTVTATGWICGAPRGFTLTYISDYEVGISWTKGADADKTMIRAAVGRMPTSRTDGYQVYYGTGTSTSDTGVSLDETAAAIVYRAWSQNAAGIWEELGVSDFIEGGGMTTIAIIVLVLGLTALAYAVKSGMLYAACIPAWLFFAFYTSNINWPIENPYLPTAIAIFGVTMTIIVIATTAMHYIGNRSAEPTYDEEKGANAAKIYKLTHKKTPWED